MKNNDLQLALNRLVDSGDISRRRDGDLGVYNYTTAHVYRKAWTEVTLAARGLILHEPSGEIVARPFPKFFNVGERPETLPNALPWHEEPEVQEKLDGSLGIVFHHDGVWRVATRGSLTSPQAVYAQEHLVPNYELDDPALGSLTLLVEIVYPSNRIVVNYGERNELVLLAARHTKDGSWVGAEELESLSDSTGLPLRQTVPWPGSLENLSHASNTEGWVLHWPDRELRVKVKSPEYIAVHRALGCLAPRRVLDLLVEGKLDDVDAQLPNHLQLELRQHRDRIVARLDALLRQAQEVFRERRDLLQESRKAFALSILDQESHIKTLLFALANQQDPWPLAAKHLRASLKAETRFD